MPTCVIFITVIIARRPMSKGSTILLRHQLNLFVFSQKATLFLVSGRRQGAGVAMEATSAFDGMP
jgi:hypothetical protein